MEDIKSRKPEENQRKTRGKPEENRQKPKGQPKLPQSNVVQTMFSAFVCLYIICVSMLFLFFWIYMCFSRDVCNLCIVVYIVSEIAWAHFWATHLLACRNLKFHLDVLDSYLVYSEFAFSVILLDLWRCLTTVWSSMIVFSHFSVSICSMTGWWFGIYFVFFSMYWNNHVNWLSFFFQRGGSTTNQMTFDINSIYHQDILNISLRLTPLQSHCNPITIPW